MVLAGCGVYRDMDHINKPLKVFFCDLGLVEQEINRNDKCDFIFIAKWVK